MKYEAPLEHLTIICLLTFIAIGLLVWVYLDIREWKQQRNNMQDFIKPAERIGPTNRGHNQWHH